MKINKRICICISLFIIICFIILLTAISLFSKKEGNRILIENENIVLPVSTEYMIRAITYPNNDEITWETSDNDIIKLNKDGSLTTLKDGEATLTAKSKSDNKKIKIVVTSESDFAETFTVKEEQVNINIGETYLLETMFGPNNLLVQSLSYESLDNNIVSVTDGYITAKNNGITQINVSMQNNDKIITDSVMVIVGDIENTKKIEKIEFKEEHLTLELKQNYQLNPIFFPENAKYDINYTIDDEEIISIEDNVITANKKGKTNVIASTSDGVSAILEVSVVANEEGILLNKESIEIAKGETYQLKSNFVSGIEWYSSNNKVATVNNNGIVKGLSDGETTITILNSYGRMNTVDVNVKGNGIPVQDITVDTKNITIKAGTAHQLNYSITPSNATNKQVTWETNDNRIVNVTDDGLIFGKMEGNTIITGYASNGKNVSVNVNVVGNNIIIDRLDINPSEMSIIKGDSYKLNASLVPSNVSNKHITWSSSDSSIVSVDQNGNIKGNKIGYAYISATNNGVTSKAKINVVNDIIEISSLNINENDLNLEVGKSKKITVSFKPENASNYNFKYSSSNENVATVTNNGIITAINKGNCTIKVEATNGISDSINITVEKKEPDIPETPNKPETNNKVNEVLLNYTSLVLQSGQTKQMKATILPLTADQSVTWVSGNEGVARVSGSGLVTAVGAGSTEVTAIAKNGIVAKMQISVLYPPIAPVGKVLKSMNSYSMQVTLERINSYHITRIWMLDPSKQIHKHGGGDGLATVPTRLLQIPNYDYLSNKIVVASNASGFHSINFEYDKKYINSPLGKLIITNNSVLRNDPYYNEHYDTQYSYYIIDKNGDLSVGSNSSSPEYFNNIIKMAKHTFAFGIPYRINGTSQATWGGVGARRQMLCQINHNNYAIVTTEMNATFSFVGAIANALGCYTAVNLDGGGSTSLVIKQAGEPLPGDVIIGGTRRVGDMIYFSEL